MLLGEFTIHDGPGAVVLPGDDLIVGNLPFFINFKELVGVGPKLREEVPRLVVFVHPTKPISGKDNCNSWNRANLFPVVARHRKDQRHLVACDQPQGRFLRTFFEIEVAPDGHHQREQE